MKFSEEVLSISHKYKLTRKGTEIKPWGRLLFKILNFPNHQQTMKQPSLQLLFSFSVYYYNLILFFLYFFLLDDFNVSKTHSIHILLIHLLILYLQLGHIWKKPLCQYDIMKSVNLVLFYYVLTNWKYFQTWMNKLELYRKITESVPK